MMGIYVKGLKMLKECRECYLLEYYEYLGETQCSVTRRMLAEREKPISFDGRPGWCPLVEVPEPHGRLIDGDEFVRIWQGAKICGSIKPLVDARPTVIEAEGE